MTEDGCVKTGLLRGEMRMKRFGMKIFTIMAAAVVLAAGILAGCQKSNEISLKDLKTGNEYQYAKAMWNASAEEVEKNLPFSMEKHPIVPEGNTGKYYVPYRSENITVDGLKATAKWEFYEDQLKMIQFNIETTRDEYREQFDREVERLTRQFGSESNKSETSRNDELLGNTETTVYRWDTENTSMQLSLMTSTYREPSILLSMSHLSLLEDKYYDMPHQ